MKFSLPQETPEGQKKAITATDKIITVGAGAGTGKTWVLSNRYLRLLIENEEILPSDILTLTYTETAAGDMKNRIEARIKDEFKNFDDYDFDFAERKREIFEGLSDSWISTIHSFAARLIRESGLSLDIDPTASVISTQQEQDFWEGIKNAAEFANFSELARTYGDKTLRDNAKILDNDDYLSAAVNRWRAQTLSDLAMKTAELHASSGNTWLEMLSWSENDILINKTKNLIKNILLNEWREVWDFWSGITLPDSKKSEGPGARLNELLDWQKNNSPENEENLKKFYENIVINKNKNITATTGEPFKTLKAIIGMTLGDWRKTKSELIKKITADFDNDFSDEELKMRKTLLKFCAVSWEMWDMMKTRRGLLSFSDMILHAKRAIENKSLNRTFADILVDEFQDTDPLQFAMIESLIGMADNTSLFAVGDPKQSIYRFRHADPSLFAKTINSAGTNVELDVSFRTRKSLLNRINKIFKSLWRDGLGKSETMSGLSFKSVNAGLDDDKRNSGTMPDFRIILARHGRSNSQEAKKNLAEELALNISEWVREGRTVWDKAAKIIRPVKFSDFAVLSRSRSIYPVLEEAFEKFNIRSIQDKSTDFFGRGEINDVVCLLRAAADMEDDFAVSGWLMSPFSGVDENEAIEKCLKLKNKKNKIIDLIKENLPEAFSKLEKFSIIGENEGAAGLLEIFDENRSWLSGYKENDRLRVLRNVRLAVTIARSFQQSGTSSLTACAEWLTKAVKNKIGYEEPAWHDENENAVKLGVVHSAKGLEYPVTVIFESRTRKDSDKGSLRPSRNLGVIFTDIPDEFSDNNNNEIKPKCADWEKLLSEQGDLEEETRLFYVAATRAQDSLIFCGLVNEKDDSPHENTWTKFLLENLDDENENENENENITPVFANGIDEFEFLNLNSEDEERILKPVKIIHTKNSLRQFSASSYSLFEWCPFAWRRNYRQGINLLWQSPKPAEIEINHENEDDDFTGGAELGSLAHWILARWLKNENYETELEYYLNDREIISLLPAYLRSVWRRKSSKAALKKWLMNFAVSDLGKKLRTEKNIQREYIFKTRLNSGTILAGAMDAYYENNIIDYKITSIENTPPGLYESQLDFYALAVHKLTGCEKVNTSIVFLREGKISERVCENFEEIRTRVENAAESCASGSYNAKTENCDLCPFMKGCAKCSII